MGAGSSSGKQIPPNLEVVLSPTSQAKTNPTPKVSKAPTATSNERKKFHQHYTLKKELGSGAFSIVKLGVNKATEDQVAVKIVSKKKLSPEDLNSLMTEIEILDSLNHPHVIKLYETFDEGNEFYIVTELVEGGELFDRIVSKTHYTEKEARDLVKVFIEAMAYIHDAGVVHRDLKPENLLLTSQSNDHDIKICDFGFAKRVSELLPDETACGTPGYVAPEILRGDPYGTEVDIWSMGVICYVLLAGYPPFYDEDQRKLFKKIKDGRYYFHEEYWSHVSPEAMDLIRKMLCVNQRQRWSAKELLRHPWIVAGDDVLDSRDLIGTVTALKKFNRKRKFKAAADAVIMSNRMHKALASLRVTPKAIAEANAFIAESGDDDTANERAPPAFDLPISPSSPSTKTENDGGSQTVEKEAAPEEVTEESAPAVNDPVVS